MAENWTLGLIGAGNMGGALVEGVLSAGLLEPENVWIYDLDAAKSGALAADLETRVAMSNSDLLARADTIVLAVKPQTMQDLLDEIAPAVQAEHLFISIAAGVPIKVFLRAFGSAVRVVRVMPNTPSLLGCGAAGLAGGGAATRDDVERALRVFRAVGVAVEVAEDQINAVTGLSGSGPAYVFYMIEAMARAGEKAGLSAGAAMELTRQTVLGAARMACETDVEPAELRRRVTSPGGTTEAGLRTMREADFAGLIERTVARATERGEELGRMFD